MASETPRAILVGAVLVAAAVVLAALMFRVSADSAPWRDRLVYRTRFPTTQGLSEGAEVRYKGVTVGSVSSIDFAEQPQLDDIIVELTVRRSLAPRIDEQVVAELRSNGPLGDRLVELRRPDVAPGTPLEEGAFIASKPPFEFGPMVNQSTDLLVDIQSISSSLAVITNRLVAGEGLFGRLLKDEDFGDRTLEDLAEAIAGMRAIVEATADGENVAGALFGRNETASEIIQQLDASLRNLERITGRVEDGEGALGMLLADESQLTQALDDVARATAELRDVAERVSAAEGTLFHRLVLDEEYGSRVGDDLAATLAHLRSIAGKVDQGEGTAGQLVNDRRIYDGLDDIVSGIESSWFVSFILKRRQKKGFKERVETILTESENPDAELVQLIRELLAAEEGRELAPPVVAGETTGDAAQPGGGT